MTDMHWESLFQAFCTGTLHASADILAMIHMAPNHVPARELGQCLTQLLILLSQDNQEWASRFPVAQDSDTVYLVETTSVEEALALCEISDLLHNRDTDSLFSTITRELED